MRQINHILHTTSISSIAYARSSRSIHGVPPRASKPGAGKGTANERGGRNLGAVSAGLSAEVTSSETNSTTSSTSSSVSTMLKSESNRTLVDSDDDEKLTGSWSRAGMLTEEYETVNRGEEPYGRKEGMKEDLRYGCMEKYRRESKVEETMRQDE